MNGTYTLSSDDLQQQVSVPADLLEQIDEQLGEEFVDRKDFVRAAIRYYLAHVQGRNDQDMIKKSVL